VRGARRKRFCKGEGPRRAKCQKWVIRNRFGRRRIILSGGRETRRSHDREEPKEKTLSRSQGRGTSPFRKRRRSYFSLGKRRPEESAEEG